MATRRQAQAAKRTIKQAQRAARSQRTISKLPRGTRRTSADRRRRPDSEAEGRDVTERASNSTRSRSAGASPAGR